MKFKPQYLLIPLLMLVGYFFVKWSMPRYTGMYLLSLLLVVGDIYLWSAFRKRVFSYNKLLRLLLIAVYWLPLMAAGFAIAGAVIVPIVEWNDVFRNYLFGSILIVYTAKLLPILFLLLADTARIIGRSFHLSKKDKRREINKEQEGITRSKFLQYIGFLSGGLVMGTMFVGMFKWVFEFKVHREKIPIAGLPKRFEGLKIVQISDFHLGNWGLTKPMDEAIATIMELKPDMIVFTGDLVTFSTREAYRFEQQLKKLKAPMGVYATLGNHDYGLYVTWPDDAARKKNMTDLYDFFDRIGWKLLNNEHMIFGEDDEQLALIGVENWGASKRFPKYGDIDKAIKGTENVPAKILLSHDPSHWDKVIVPGNYPIDLTLSGHTHGFQFGLESQKIKWSPAQYVYKHWAGLYRHPMTHHYLYVNRGIGSIGYPGRIGILPEITLLELRKG